VPRWRRCRTGARWIRGHRRRSASQQSRHSSASMTSGCGWHPNTRQHVCARSCHASHLPLRKPGEMGCMASRSSAANKRFRAPLAPQWEVGDEPWARETRTGTLGSCVSAHAGGWYRRPHPTLIRAPASHGGRSRPGPAAAPPPALRTSALPRPRRTPQTCRA